MTKRFYRSPSELHYVKTAAPNCIILFLLSSSFSGKVFREKDPRQNSPIKKRGIFIYNTQAVLRVTRCLIRLNSIFFGFCFRVEWLRAFAAIFWNCGEMNRAVKKRWDQNICSFLWNTPYLAADLKITVKIIPSLFEVFVFCLQKDMKSGRSESFSFRVIHSFLKYLIYFYSYVIKIRILCPQYSQSSLI